MATLANPAAPNTFNTFGDLLKYLRRRERLTQLDLSIAVGYSEGQISRLEKNQRPPDLAAVKALFIPALHLEQDPELAERLLQLAQSARQEDAPAPGIPPYRGLLYFDVTDAEWFFGREQLTARLTERVTAVASGTPPRVFSVIGASGSGKSSIVRAGLAVQLARAGWTVRVFTPTAEPLKMLDAQIGLTSHDAGDAGAAIVDQFEEVFTLCREETTRASFIARLLQLANEPHGMWNVVIVLRADFYSHCAQYPQLRQALASRQEFIGQMSEQELRRAIEEPARRGGWELQPGLVDLMLGEIGASENRDPEPGALPLLSHALLATWERRQGRTFTLEGYRASGGVRGAIAETAESVFTDQFNRPQQEYARDIFLRLTELGEGTEDTRRRASLTELVPTAEEAAMSRAVLNTLADARLLSIGENSAEVAHEALIREWQRLRAWLDEDRAQLRLHRQLTEAAHEWESLARDPGALLRGTRLAQIQEFAVANPKALNDKERGFLSVSVENEEREARDREEVRQRELRAAQDLAEEQQERAQEQTRAAHQLRRMALFLAGALLVALVLAGLALLLGNQARVIAVDAEQNALRAENEKRIATARELAAAAIGNLTVDPERSILLAMQAVRSTHSIDGTTTREAVEALHRAIQNSRLQNTFYGETPNPAVAFSPDGTRVAIGEEGGKITLWDFVAGKEIFELAAPDENLMSIAFRPDGTRLASISGSGTMRVWDLNSRRQVFSLEGANGRPAHSYDGKRLAFGAENNTKILDAETGAEVTTLAGHTANVVAVDFSPDGRRLATASDDNSVKVWDLATGNELFALQDFASFVAYVKFSPDGTRLATAGDPNGPIVWDAATGEQLFAFSPVNAVSNGLEFSADGKYLTVGSQDGTAYVWDATTGQEFLALAGASPINDLAMSSGCVAPPSAPFEWCGAHIATASRDGTVKVWNLSTSGSRELLTVPGLWHFVNADGTELVTSTVDSDGALTNRIWELPIPPAGLDNVADISANIAAQAGVQETSYVLGESDVPVTVAMDPAHTTSSFVNSGGFAALNTDYSEIEDKFELTARVLDASNGNEKLSFPMPGHTAPLLFGALVSSPDGTRLASGSFDGTARIWDLSNDGKELAVMKADSIGIIALDYRPDGKQLATAGKDGIAKVWDAETGEELRSLEGHTDWLANITFSPDGTQLATSSFDGTAKVWDLATGKEILTLTGHPATVWALAYSADGKRLATGSSDGTARVWEAATGELLLELSIPAGVQQMSFSPDGTRLITTSIADGTVRAYLLDTPDLMALARTRVTRPLTQAECQAFLHVNECPTE
jgi:WD40 repeat protein/transcriptional regulator with XRE-family HTH domain